ncbi:MAG: FAD-dependent oxidoreductase [Patescibacteria group bacterium]
MAKKKNIVILGAGFAGIRAARILSKKLDLNRFELFLVDKKSVHIYTPDLYEVASNFHQEITEQCLIDLKETVATQIETIVDPKKIRFIQAEIKKIDPKKKKISLVGKTSLDYDYLVVTLGSVVNYQGIEGLEQFSYPVKSMDDAILINCHLDTYFRSLWKKNVKKDVMITIGGGGVTGVEFASEMAGYLRQLSKKYKYPLSHIHAQVIQGADELIGVGKKVSEIALERLKKKNVNVMLGHYIKKVQANKIVLQSKDGKKKKIIKSDMLMWTGGVKPNPVVAASLGSDEFKGAIAVNEQLQSVKYKAVFAGGDNAAFVNKKGERAPWLAQAAVEQGEVIAENIVALTQRRPLKSYKLRTYPMIIPIAGQFGIVKMGPFVYKGWLGWVVRRFTDLTYAMSILPFGKALKKWWRGNKVFIEND